MSLYTDGGGKVSTRKEPIVYTSGRTIANSAPNGNPYSVNSAPSKTVVSRVGVQPAALPGITALSGGAKMTGVPTSYIKQYAAPAAPKSLQLTGTPTGWIDQVAANQAQALPFSAYGGSSVGNYQFRGGGGIAGAQINPLTGQVQQGDFGIDFGQLQIAKGVGQVGSAANVMQGAQAAERVIKDWGSENMAAAAASEIDRGMGRSGAYDAAQAMEAYKADLAIQQAYGDAAAKQGELDNAVALQNGQTAYNVANANQGATQAAMLQRAQLNQQIALANGSQEASNAQFNAGNSLDAQKANQSALLQSDSIQSAYNMNKQQLDQQTWLDNVAQQLDYANSDRQQQQFYDQLAQAQTEANRGYQMDRMGYSNGQYQFGMNYALDKTAADRGYQQQGLNYNEGIRQYNTSQGLAQWQAQQQALQAAQSLAQNQSQYDQSFNYNAGQDAYANQLNAAKMSSGGGSTGPTYADQTARANARSNALNNLGYLVGPGKQFPNNDALFAYLGL